MENPADRYDSAGFLMLCGVIHAGEDQALGRLP
jgi:hypothetical protein